MFTVAPEKLQAEVSSRYNINNTSMNHLLMIVQPNQVENEERLTRDRPASKIDKQHLKSVRSFEEDSSMSASESTASKTISPRSSLQPGSTLGPTTSPTGTVAHVDPLTTNSAADTTHNPPDQSTDSLKVVTAYTAPFSYTSNSGTPQPTSASPSSRPGSTRVKPQDSLRAPLLADSEVSYNGLERGQARRPVQLHKPAIEPGCCASCNIM